MMCEKRKMPDGFAADAPRMSCQALAKKYHASGSMISRWRAELEAEGKPAFLRPEMRLRYRKENGTFSDLPAPRKPENDPVLLESCYYNLRVECAGNCRNGCETCGWNPEVQARRKKMKRSATSTNVANPIGCVL